MNTNTQFESVNFVTGPQKAQKTPRLRKVVLITSVVLLVTGAYYYGASTAKAPQVHKKTTLFRSYSPRTNAVSAYKKYAVDHSGKDELSESEIFYFQAFPVLFKPDRTQPLIAGQESYLWAVAIRSKRRISENKIGIPPIQTLTFQKQLTRKGAYLFWYNEEVNVNNFQDIMIEPAEFLICVTGQEFKDWEYKSCGPKHNTYCAPPNQRKGFQV